MLNDTHPTGKLNWLRGVAISDDDAELPMLACASKSELRAAEVFTAVPLLEGDVAARRGGLRLIVNDDHGMMPTVTMVNQGDDVVVLKAIRPSVVMTDNGTYDLDALLAGSTLTIEPGQPRVIRITDIGRNAGDTFRHGTEVIRYEDSDGFLDMTSRFAS